MIKGTINQLHNVNNPHQGKYKKVLTVCSAGLLRSATLQNVLISEYGYNVRNCGIHDYALIPISVALIKWADEIIFVEKKLFKEVEKYLVDFNALDKSYTMFIPDIYEFKHPDLVQICKKEYEKILEVKDARNKK